MAEDGEGVVPCRNKYYRGFLRNRPRLGQPSPESLELGGDFVNKRQREWSFRLVPAVVFLRESMFVIST
jgi:hypothetical protein